MTDNTQNLDEQISDILAALYLAGTENGLGRQLTDPAEIMHRKEAFINANPASTEAKQAILNWHNKQVKNAVATAEDNLDQYWNKELDKQVEAVLDRLESQSRRADDCTDDTLVVKMIRVGAERDRLNSSKSTPFNKLKESK